MLYKLINDQNLQCGCSRAPAKAGDPGSKPGKTGRNVFSYIFYDGVTERKENMNYYAHVYFGPDERTGQRNFLLLMNSVEIIQTSRQDIEDWYREDISHNAPGCDNHLVLHGEEQKNRFSYAMNTFFPAKTYEITEEPGSREFERWLREKDARKTSP